MGKNNMSERYVIFKDFNTKDWCVYDNTTHRIVCHCDTEEEATLVVNRLEETV